jgi:hypothetical protein
LIQNAPLQHAPVEQVMKERTLEEYEAEYRANQQVGRLLNIDLDAGLRFILGALAGGGVVRYMYLSGTVTDHLWVWMIAGTLGTGLLCARLSWLASDLLRYILPR